jgi:uncharacterized protein (DUF4415 family)
MAFRYAPKDKTLPEDRGVARLSDRGVEQSDKTLSPGARLIESAKEAVAIAKGEKQAARAFIPEALKDAVAEIENPQKGGKERKKAISIRLDEDVLEWWKASGAGWQSRMNDWLRKAMG